MGASAAIGTDLSCAPSLRRSLRCSLICPAPPPPGRSSDQPSSLLSNRDSDYAETRPGNGRMRPRHAFAGSCFLCFVLGLFFVIPPFFPSPRARLFPLSAPCHFSYLLPLSRSNVPIPLLLLLLYLSPPSPRITPYQAGPAKQLDEIFVWGHVCRFLPLGDNFNQTRQKDVFTGWQTQRGRQTEEEGAGTRGKRQNLELVKLLFCDGTQWLMPNMGCLYLVSLSRWSKSRSEVSQSKTATMCARHRLIKVSES